MRIIKRNLPPDVPDMWSAWMLSRQRRIRPYLVLSLFLALYVVLDRPKELSDAVSTSTKPNTAQREPRLGDGCYHVFLDVGANVGVHGRFLLEPEKYSKNRLPKKYVSNSVDLFDKEYGLDRDNRDICVFEFEANHRHWPRLLKISEAYAKMGWRYRVLQAAVSDQNGSTTFFHQGDEYNNEWGFSGAKDMRTAGKKEGLSTTEVPTVRLSEWMQTHIHERLVPDEPHQKSPPRLTMKMDIEGYEYIVLPDLINTGALCPVDLIFGEFHSWMAPITTFRSFGSTHEDFHRVSLDTKDQLKTYEKSLVQVMQASRNCGVRFLSFDDESHLHDKKPLPTPGDAGRKT